MSSVPPGGWGPDDTGAVPVGPEPEPTGVGGAGSGGWGEAPRTEPFAIAALVCAIGSIILPIIGTILALVLAGRAADSIRRSQGTRSGWNLVNAARIIAGVVIALWAIGLIVYVATRNESTSSNVAVPTQPTSSSTTTRPPSTTVTTRPLTTSTTNPPVTITTAVQPTVTVVPPTVPPTVAPTQPTVAPTTLAPTTTTAAPTTTTSPEQGEEAKITAKLLEPSSIGPSNRGLTDEERVTVRYTVGQPLVITWAINNGSAPLPTGTPTCASPPPPPTTTSSTTTSSTTTSSTTSSSSTSSSTTTTTLAPTNSTALVARNEAKKILATLKADIQSGKLDVTGVQLIGTFPIEGTPVGDLDVVQSFYANDTVIAGVQTTNVFTVPKAEDVQCLNPAFA